jgi:hypothetical protein
MKIIIVDDDNDKIAHIVSAIRSISSSFDIESAIDLLSAKAKLLVQKYDIMLLDIVLPLRPGEPPLDTGGKILLEEIERVNNLIPPTYIIGITQFVEYQNILLPLWYTLHYQPSSVEWVKDLQKMIQYFNNVIERDSKKINLPQPTIFVEGKSDKAILEEAMQLFNPEMTKVLKIKSDCSAGADWVAKQIIIWGKYLKRNEDGELIKSIGLLDNDMAGLTAKAEIFRVLKSSNELQSFKVMQYSPSHARHLINHYKKGVKIPISLEEMYPPEIWQFAETQGWLENRNNPDSFLEDPKLWDKLNKSLNSYLDDLGFSDVDKLYLKKVRLEKKEDLCAYIQSLSMEEKSKTLIAFALLIEEINTYFFKDPKE